MHSAGKGLTPDDILVLEAPKRVLLQHGKGETGADELVLFYGDKEVSFDEPHLFAFAETLAQQTSFRAADAAAWGDGLQWPEVRDCLSALLEAGILVPAAQAAPPPPLTDRSRPSPLPPAVAQAPFSWNDLEAITRDLAGHAVEPGWLELVVPVFRVAHMTLDADDRQVGEANVFPRALRLDRPTEWMACTYRGTRYLDPRPMNVTAMKAMRAHWTEMMMALAFIRDAYLTRCPQPAGRLTIGAIERLATLVLAVPTYQLVKANMPVAGGELHPALSSLFRVTDGLRLVMHQMLFVPVGEPTMPPDTPMTAAQILDYAERNFAFHSETGVCAGPRHFVQAFLDVLVEGRQPEILAGFEFSPSVAAALAEIEEAFAYGLEALRAHAVLFTFWPKMVRCYESLATIVAGAHLADPSLAPLHHRLQDHLITAERSTYLGSEAWRSARESAYADMFEACSAGLGQPGLRLDSTLAVQRGDVPEGLIAALFRQIGQSEPILAARPETTLEIAHVLLDFALETRALLAASAQCQSRINALLRRPAPVRPFGVNDINVHVLLQGPQPGKRLPFIIDELKSLFGVDLAIDAGHIGLSVAEDPSPR